MTSSSTLSADAGRSASGVRRLRGPRGIGVGAALAIGALPALVILVLDQWSKHWAQGNLELLEPRPLIGELLQLTLLYNSGAAWGMGSEITPVITVIQIAICLGALVFLSRSVRSIPWALALGLIVGGALGNIHDRLLRAPGPFRGEVVDFLALPHWPVFNVADMAVTSGAVLIVLLGVLGVAIDPAGDDGDEREGEVARRAVEERHGASDRDEGSA